MSLLVLNSQLGCLIVEGETKRRYYFNGAQYDVVVLACVHRDDIVGGKTEIASLEGLNLVVEDGVEGKANLELTVFWLSGDFFKEYFARNHNVLWFTFK